MPRRRSVISRRSRSAGRRPRRRGAAGSGRRDRPRVRRSRRLRARVYGQPAGPLVDRSAGGLLVPRIPVLLLAVLLLVPSSASAAFLEPVDVQIDSQGIPGLAGVLALTVSGDGRF